MICEAAEVALRGRVAAQGALPGPGPVRRIGVQPEDQVYWTQYRLLPRPQMFIVLDRRWLDAAGWQAFDDLNGYELSAPEAVPTGCQAGGEAWCAVANVPREWEEHERRRALIERLLRERAR